MSMCSGEPRLRKTQNHSGYAKINIAIRGQQRMFPVHRLVLEAFVGSRPSRNHEASHVNGRPSDNRLGNLKWETRRQKAQRKRDHGTYHLGTRNGARKLNDAVVREIRTEYARGVTSQPALARRYGVAQSTIWQVLARITWEHVA